MTRRALIRLHIPTTTYISSGRWRLPAAKERAPEAKTKRWKGVSDLLSAGPVGQWECGNVQAIGIFRWVFEHILMVLLAVEGVFE